MVSPRKSRTCESAMMHRDAGGEADHDRDRHEAHQRAHAEGAHGEEQHAGHHRGDEQVRHAVLLRDRVERCPTKAPAGPAICTFEPPRSDTSDAAHDRGDDALLGTHAGGDREGHGERQRHQRHGDAGAKVGDEVLAAGTP